MTNSLAGDHQVAVVNMDENVLEGFDMSGTHLNAVSKWSGDLKVEKSGFFKKSTSLLYSKHCLKKS